GPRPVDASWGPRWGGGPGGGSAPADLLVGNNVLAHAPDVTAFLSSAGAVLAADGVAVFEFPYLADLLAGAEFDTIYHEHVFYFSLAAIEGLARRAGLRVFDVARP